MAFYRFTPLACLASLILVMGVCTTARAADDWQRFDSKTGLISLKMPAGSQENASIFMAGPASGAISSEISSVLDQDPYKQVVKSYALKADQTFGSILTGEEIDALIEADLDSYEDMYLGMNGTTKSRNRDFVFNFPSGEILIGYTDPKLGKQDIRIRVFYTNVMKVQQIVLGPESTMFSYKTRDYFDSLNVVDSYMAVPDSDRAPWDNYSSPYNLFTLSLPPKAETYFSSAPTIKSTPKSEFIGAVFHDPIRNANLFFNVYGYKLNTELTFSNALKVVTTNHVSKYKADPRTMQFTKNFDSKGMPLIEAQFKIPAPEKHPYMTNAWVRSYFAGPYMIVEEALGPATLVQSEFTERLIENVKFQPEKADYTSTKEPSAPSATTPQTAPAAE